MSIFKGQNQMTNSTFHTVSAPVEITRKQICELICGCIENPFSWFEGIEGFVLPENLSKIDFQEDGKRCFSDWPSVYAVITDSECKVTFKVEEPVRKDRENFLIDIGPEELKKGLDLMAASSEYQHHFSHFIAEDYDAITSDVFMQFVIYGEVIFC